MKTKYPSEFVSAERVWLVYFPREVQETQALGEELAALSWLNRHFAPAGQEQFGDLTVALWQEGP